MNINNLKQNRKQRNFRLFKYILASEASRKFSTHLGSVFAQNAYTEVNIFWAVALCKLFIIYSTSQLGQIWEKKKGFEGNWEAKPKTRIFEELWGEFLHFSLTQKDFCKISIYQNNSSNATKWFIGIIVHKYISWKTFKLKFRIDSRFLVSNYVTRSP